jgi:hypothetical protein
MGHVTGIGNNKKFRFKNFEVRKVTLWRPKCKLRRIIKKTSENGIWSCFGCIKLGSDGGIAGQVGSCLTSCTTVCRIVFVTLIGFCTVNIKSCAAQDMHKQSCKYTVCHWQLC